MATFAGAGTCPYPEGTGAYGYARRYQQQYRRSGKTVRFPVEKMPIIW
ncbi:hypothetical protein [Chitinophaga sp.]